MKIKQTREYELFKKLPGNRPVNELHVKRLMESMKKQFLMRPIDVNENMEVIDGQHRLRACMLLKLPVYYVIQKGWVLQQAHMLNANQKNWTLEQYIQGYCDMEKAEYIKLREFKKEHKLPFTILHMLAAQLCSRPGGSETRNFKDGKFRFVDVDWARDMAEKIKQIGEYHECNVKVSFVTKFLQCIKSGMDFDQFLNKLKYRSKLLDGCATEPEYLVAIEKIYNYKSRDKVRFY